MSKRKAGVLLSGGLDSTTVLAIACEARFDVYALSFGSGQRHWFELEAAKNIAARYAIRRHVIFDVNLSQFGGSALTDDSAEETSSRIDGR